MYELEDELSELTDGWELASISRTYPVSEAGEEDLADDQTILSAHGYELISQAVGGGHVHVGRLLLTVGWSVLAGRSGIRSDATLTVVFKRQPAFRVETSDPLDQLAKLGQLRDAGYLTGDEFEKKKRSLLDRL